MAGPQRAPPARGVRAVAPAAEGPDEDGVHRQSDQAARVAVRDHGLPGDGGARGGGEEHRAERGDGQGESDLRVRCWETCLPSRLTGKLTAFLVINWMYSLFYCLSKKTLICV